MITRRHIRIKVLHHLYAHAADAESSAAVLLKNLNKSLEEVHHLFVWDISALLRIYSTAIHRLEKVQQRNVADTDLESRIQAFVAIPFFNLVQQDHRLIAFKEGFIQIGANTALTSSLFVMIYLNPKSLISS